MYPNVPELMQAAIDVARSGMQAGQSPFGAAVWMEGATIAAGHNTVLATCDATAHAEVNAIRQACQVRGEHFLEGAHVATTCEPCPMCMAALHWARVDTVYFGASISDAAAAGFNELAIAAQDLVRLGGSPVKLVGDVLTQPCQALFAEWSAMPDARSY